MTDFAVVASFGSEADAFVARAVLAAHDIEAHLQSDTAGGMLPHLDPRHGVRLVVARADEAEARSLLAESDG
jgi:hypothetical protein